MYTKPELALLGSAIAVVLGESGPPGEMTENPPEKIEPGIATNLDE